MTSGQTDEQALLQPACRMQRVYEPAGMYTRTHARMCACTQSIAGPFFLSKPLRAPAPRACMEGHSDSAPRACMEDHSDSPRRSPNGPWEGKLRAARQCCPANAHQCNVQWHCHWKRGGVGCRTIRGAWAHRFARRCTSGCCRHGQDRALSARSQSLTAVGILSQDWFRCGVRYRWRRQTRQRHR